MPSLPDVCRRRRAKNLMLTRMAKGSCFLKVEPSFRAREIDSLHSSATKEIQECFVNGLVIDR